MRYKFNQQAAIWTFSAVVLVFVLAVGITRFQNGKEVPLLGALIYGILGLFASIITGLMVPEKKLGIPYYDYDLNENENDKENERRSIHGKTKKETSRKTKEYK